MYVHWMHASLIYFTTIVNHLVICHYFLQDKKIKKKGKKIKQFIKWQINEESDIIQSITNNMYPRNVFSSIRYNSYSMIQHWQNEI